MRSSVAGMVLGLFVVAGCTDGPDERDTGPAPSPPSSSSAPPSPPAAPVFEVERVVADVRHLADVVGPRHATSPAFAEAASWAEGRLQDLGYEVEVQQVPVPAGTSWGVPVDAGISLNVIASPPGFDSAAPHRVVGAHLDTVPQAPGAEDNASGVALMLELARLQADSPLPVRFVAFGAEEPRGPGDDLHHFGSQAYVASLTPEQRNAVVAMVSLDRVGVPGEIPVCHGGAGSPAVRDSLVSAAVVAGVAHRPCADNRTSDHWSFERNGLPAARLGSIPYAGYHAPGDVPSVVDPGQLSSVAAIMVRWLRDAA